MDQHRQLIETDVFGAIYGYRTAKSALPEPFGEHARDGRGRF